MAGFKKLVGLFLFSKCSTLPLKAVSLSSLTAPMMAVPPFPCNLNARVPGTPCTPLGRLHSPLWCRGRRARMFMTSRRCYVLSLPQGFREVSIVLFMTSVDGSLSLDWAVVFLWRTFYLLMRLCKAADVLDFPPPRTPVKMYFLMEILRFDCSYQTP